MGAVDFGYALGKRGTVKMLGGSKRSRAKSWRECLAGEGKANGEDWPMDSRIEGPGGLRGGQENTG